MADNLTTTATVSTIPDATVIATRLAAHAGDTASFQGIFPVYISGSEGSYTVNEVFFLEDTQHASGAAGNMPLAVRNDTLAALAGSDGDYAPFQVNASGALFIQEGAAMDVSAATVTVDGSGVTQPVSGTVTANLSATDNAVLDTISTAVVATQAAVEGTLTVTGGGGGTEYTEDVATANPIVGTATLVERDDALSTVTPIEGDWLGLRGTAEGALWTQDFNSDAVQTAIEAVQTAVEGTLTVTGGGGGTEYTEDVATANPQVGTATLMERDDVLSTVTPVEADWIGLRGNARGALWVEADPATVIATVGSVTAITNALPAGTNAIGKLAANSGVDIGDVDVSSLPASIDGPGAPTIDSYSYLAINLNAAANQVLVSSALNKQIWVYGVSFTCSAAGTVSFQDEDDTALTGIMDFAANSGMARNPSGNFAMPIWKLATDKDLEVDVVTAAIDGDLQYAILSV